MNFLLENLQSPHEGVILRVNIWSCRHFDGTGCPRCRHFDGMGCPRRLSVRSICRRLRVHGLANQAARSQPNAIAGGFRCKHCQTDSINALSGRRLALCDTCICQRLIFLDLCLRGQNIWRGSCPRRRRQAFVFQEITDLQINRPHFDVF